MGCSESEYNETRTPSMSRRYLHVPVSTLNFSSDKSSKSVSIESDETAWKINIPANWLSVNSATGTSSSNVEFSVQANNTADTSRVCIAEIMSDVTDWNRTFPITVTQASETPYITLEQKELVCTASTQTQEIAISCNTSYTISNNASNWLHVVSYSPTSLSLKIDENNTDSERSGVIVLTAEKHTNYSSSLSIRQKKSGIVSSINELMFGPDASSQSITITSDASWTASSTAWLQADPSSGLAGTSEVKITATRNASTNTRTGSVYFTIAGTNSLEVPVKQEGIILNVSSQDLEYSSFGGTLSLNITSNDSWTVTSVPDWVSLDKKSGTGNATMNVSVDENNSTEPLSGNLVIANSEGLISKTISINVAAKKAEASDVVLTFSYGAGSQTYNFITDGNWSLSTDSDWFSVDKTSGSGSATLYITVLENTSLTQRKGLINLVIAGKTYTIEINQECRYLSLSSSAFNFSAQEGNTVVSVTSNTDWTAKVVEGSYWLSVSPTSGNKNAELTIKAKENTTAMKRTGKIYVDIPNIHTYVVNITQDHKFIETDLSSVNFTKVGGSLSFTVRSDGEYDVSKIGSWFGFIISDNIITVVASENTTGSSRSGAIIIKLKNLTEGEYSLMIPVTQL